MSESIENIIDSEGNISPEALASQFHITIDELASMTGLSVNSLSKQPEGFSEATQVRLREISLIMNRTLQWSGSFFQAYAWYRSEGIPGFGGITAEQLVKRGKAQQVMNYLNRINEGGIYLIHHEVLALCEISSHIQRLCERTHVKIILNPISHRTKSCLFLQRK